LSNADKGAVGLIPALELAILTVIVWVFIVYSRYIGCCRVPKGYVASRLTMSNKVYILQVSNGEDPKLLSKIITTGNGSTRSILMVFQG